MKGQFIFEFLISGLVFFAVVLFTINFLTSNVSSFKNQFYIDHLQIMALRSSELLTNGNSQMNLVDGWPTYSVSKIDAFTALCQNANEYNKIRELLGLSEATSFGTRLFDINVMVSWGSETRTCGPPIPAYVSKAEIKRYGLLDTGEFVKLNIVVW